MVPLSPEESSLLILQWAYDVGVDAVELGTIAVTTSIATTDSWSVALKAAAVLLLLM